MVWIFALGIIALAVYHPGFRKVIFWLAGITTGSILFAFVIGQIQQSERERAAAATNAAYEECVQLQTDKNKDPRTAAIEAASKC